MRELEATPVNPFLPGVGHQPVITLGKAVYGADASKRIIMFADQLVNEGGSGNYTIYFNRRLGTALEAASAADDLFFIKVGKC